MPLCKNWSYKLVAVFFLWFMMAMFMTVIMRRMRNLTQIELRQQNENKRLNKGYENTEWHQQ